ncbi:YjgN family protein [Photobacterium sp. 1_MG-2023]|uniref:YjgN family protein n=1 Tax=Photobacterium sp. 1_MG-2023 TaxID=3062646 RepID=UPI0026E39B32|nr:YjgN family protein [Photobacterium sp. 1_MG-2023]MDO6704876.1 YjgN family protein [Photobacterium sp. 1_MG-2023]
MNNKVIFHGKGGEFFGIWIVNILLSVVTLGIYSAWAKVRTKKYFYGNTELAGDRFDYHATPTQILIGRIIAFVCVLIWAIANATFPLVASLLMLIFVGFTPILARNNARFDARMSSYRNVRFNFTGSVKGAYWAMMGAGLIGMIPLVFLAIITALVAAHSVVLVIICGILTVAAYLFLFAYVSAAMTRYFANGYQYGDRPFRAEISTEFFIKTILLGALMGAGLTIVMMAVAAIIAVVIAFLTMSSGEMGTVIDQFWFMVGGMSGMVYVILLMAFIAVFVQVRVRNYTFAQLVVSGDPEYGFTSTVRTRSFVWLMITNFLAQAFSLGLARAWVMVRTTRFLCEHTSVVGDLSLLTAKGEVMDEGAAIADEVASAFDIEMGLG